MPNWGPFAGLRFPPEGKHQEPPVVSQARAERAIFHGPFLKQMPAQAAKISRNCCLAARRSVKRAKGGGTAGLGHTQPFVSSLPESCEVGALFVGGTRRPLNFLAEPSSVGQGAMGFRVQPGLYRNFPPPSFSMTNAAGKQMWTSPA